MKKIIAFLLLTIPAISQAEWKLNPYTQRQDYYEGTAAVKLSTGVIAASVTAETAARIAGDLAVEVSTGSTQAELTAYKVTVQVSTAMIYAAVNSTGSALTVETAARVAADLLLIPSSATGTYPLSISGNAATIVGPVPASAVDLSTVTTAINLKLSSPTVSAPDGFVLTQTAGLPTWQPAISAGMVTYFFDNSVSGVSGYELMRSSDTMGNISTRTATIAASADVLVSTFIASMALNTAFINAGPWCIHQHANVSGTGGANRTGQIFSRVYYSSGTTGATETLMFTTEVSPALTTAIEPVEICYQVADTAWTNTNYFIVKNYVRGGAGATATTVSQYKKGIYQSHLSLPPISVDAAGRVRLDTVQNWTAHQNLNAGVTVSTLTVTGSNGEFGMRVSSNIYVVGYSSASAYYGSGANLTGQANNLRVSTATYLATAPGNCSAGQFISGLTADGTRTCGVPTGSGDVLKASTQTFTGQNTFTGQVTISTNIAIAKTYTESISSETITGTKDISFSSSTFYWVALNASTTFTFSNVVPNSNLTFFIEQSSNTKLVTWPSYVDWGTAGAITLSTATRKVDMVNVLCLSATKCYGKGNKDGYTAP